MIEVTIILIYIYRCLPIFQFTTIRHVRNQWILTYIMGFPTSSNKFGSQDVPGQLLRVTLNTFKHPTK
jgi:hypothetical protein